MGPKKKFCFVEFSLSLSLSLLRGNFGCFKVSKKGFSDGSPRAVSVVPSRIPRKRKLKECDLNFVLHFKFLIGYCGLQTSIFQVCSF